jgi:hypothetical protein
VQGSPRQEKRPLSPSTPKRQGSRAGALRRLAHAGETNRARGVGAGARGFTRAAVERLRVPGHLQREYAGGWRGAKGRRVERRARVGSRLRASRYCRLPQLGQPSRFAERVTGCCTFVPSCIVKTSAKVPPRGFGAPFLSVAKTIDVPSGENEPART